MWTINIILRRRHQQLLQRRRRNFRETKPLHDSDGRLQYSNREKNKPYGNATDSSGLGLRNDSGDTSVEWATSRKYTITNTMFQKKAGRRRTWKSPNDVTKIEIDYILTNRPGIVTNVTVIKQVNIGSDHRLVMSKLDVEVESKKKLWPKVDAKRIGSRKIEYQLELRNIFETLQDQELQTDLSTIRHL